MQAKDLMISEGAQKRLIITIDGPVGAGKSTVAKMLAKRLGYRYVDSGAMYRGIACAALKENVDLEDKETLSSLIPKMRIEFSQGGLEMKTYLRDRDISEEIRSPEVSQASSRISVLKEVRDRLVALQRQIGEELDGGVVMEGRDIGTVVFPGADIKFFLDGSPEERARRRHEELAGAGVDSDLTKTMQEIQIRDERDRGRILSPLKPAVDSIVIDSTNLSVEEVVNVMLGKIEERLGVP
jgi:CMP/dCMP kinase